MPESAGKAVFLSYASQDAEAARRMSDALRSAGVEVWLDQEGGLVGGDVWDRKIRDQITACALFVPLISANTQARKEGYFRLEWHLAEERVRLIAKGVPFLVPVSVDGTSERGALVPDAFLAVQWTRLRPAGYAGQGLDDASVAAFGERVKKLLGQETAGAMAQTAARPVESVQSQPAPTAPPGSIVRSDAAGQSIEPPGVTRFPREGAFETVVPLRPLWRRVLPLVGALGVGVLLTVAVERRLRPPAASAPVTRFSHRLPENQTFRASRASVLAVAPDGRRFAYCTFAAMHLRSLEELEERVIPFRQGFMASPFFSPDGNWLGYAEVGQLKRVAVGGGVPVVICKISSGLSGASWGTDGTILFGQPAGILRVPATGGTPTVVIPAQNDAEPMSPQLLPDGDTVLFTERPAGISAVDGTRIVAQKISTGARKVLVEGGVEARYLATGHLVYAVGNVLMGVAFDARRLVVTGGPVPVVQHVMRSFGPGNDAANYGIAADGTLVWAYSTASIGNQMWQLGLSDRAGKLTPLALPAGPYESPRVSPDGTRVAVGVADPKGSYVAIYDLDGKTQLRRLTFDGNSRYPVWSRDGQRVAFQSDREGDLAIFWQRADGTPSVERLTKPEKGTAHVPASWSPQDETLLFTVVPSNAQDAPGALWTYTRASGTAEAFGNVNDVAQSPMFSPDGRWLTYSVRGGTNKIFVQPFPATGAQSEVGPGTQGFWSPDGKMLTYAPGPTSFAAVTVVTTPPTVAFGNPTPVPRPFGWIGTTMPRGYDIMPDNRLIGLISPGHAAETGPPEIRVVLNWFEELKRLVPVK